MDNKKFVGVYCEKIARRKFLTALFSIGCLSTTTIAGAISFVEKPEKKSIVPKQDYVLVDGWLLRADDLYL